MFLEDTQRYTNQEISTYIENLRNLNFSNFNDIVEYGAKSVAALMELSVNSGENLAILGIAAYALRQIGFNAIPTIIAALQSDNVNIRQYAVSALGFVEPSDSRVVPALIQSLKNQDQTVRLKAVHTLGKIKSSASTVISALIQALQDENKEVRRDAARVIGTFGSSATAAALNLIQAFEDEEFEVRERALEALIAIKPPASVAVPALMEILTKSDNSVVLSTAINALSKFGSSAAPAVPTLMKALQNELTQCDAAYALAGINSEGFFAFVNFTQNNEAASSCAIFPREINPEAVPTLIELLQNEDSVVRSIAAYALQVVGPLASAAIPELIEAIGDDEPFVRSIAAYALGTIGASTAAIPVLINALKDRDPVVRESAAFALGKIKSSTSETVPPLIELLDDEDSSVRCFAIEALGEMGSLASAAIPALTKVSENDRDNRGIAAFVLDKISPLTSVESLIQVLQEKNNNLFAAIEDLGEIGSSASAAVPILIEFLQDEELKISTVNTLGKIGTPATEIVPALIATFPDEDFLCFKKLDGFVNFDCIEIAVALTNIAPGDIVPLLISFLQNSDVSICRHAAYAWRMLAAIDAIGTKIIAPTIIPALEKALQSRDVGVRGNVAIALGIITGIIEKENFESIEVVFLIVDELVQAIARLLKRSIYSGLKYLNRYPVSLNRSLQ